MMVMAMMMGLGVIMMIIIDDAYESCCEDNDEDMKILAITNM